MSYLGSWATNLKSKDTLISLNVFDHQYGAKIFNYRRLFAMDMSDHLQICFAQNFGEFCTLVRKYAGSYFFTFFCRSNEFTSKKSNLYQVSQKSAPSNPKHGGFPLRKCKKMSLKVFRDQSLAFNSLQEYFLLKLIISTSLGPLGPLLAFPDSNSL